MSVLDKRVVLVTGKGGVGKTTVAAALALKAAASGKRVLLCETHGSQRLSAVFGQPPAEEYSTQRLHEQIYGLTITSDRAIEDYVVQQVKVRSVYKLVFRNRIMGPFMDAVPGLHDLVQLGKVFDLEREQRWGRKAWDLIIVDAPATGHGLTLLSAPQAMMNLTVAGPFHENARVVAELFADPDKTGLVLVSLPEDMPVNETVELYERLGEFQSQVDLCVLNEVHPPPLSELDAWDAALPVLQERPALAESVALTDAAVRRARREDTLRQRLRQIPAVHADLPFLFTRALENSHLQTLAEALP